MPLGLNLFALYVLELKKNICKGSEICKMLEEVGNSKAIEVPVFSKYLTMVSL